MMLSLQVVVVEGQIVSKLLVVVAVVGEEILEDRVLE
jgi:hypothetical protein